MLKMRQWFASILCVAAVCGCASVSITKISDTVQDKSADGMRFYRPRPYLVIHQPTPVGGGDFVVAGQVDAKGNVVSVDSQTLPPVIRDYFPVESGSSKTLIPFDSITLSAEAVGASDQNTESTETGGNESAAQKPNSPSSSNGSSASSAGKKPASRPTTSATTQESDSGLSKASIRTTDGGPEPVVKLDDLFSITYLPDFDENYVVKVDGGWFGTGSADLAMKYGWLVERAQWDDDNRGAGQFLSQTVQTAIQTAGAVINPASALPSAASELAKMVPNKSSTEAATQSSRVLLRVRYVVEAQPGIYPILKSKEFGSAVSIPGNVSLAANPVLLPMPPYTVVAYNYRRVLDIQLMNASSTKDTKTNNNSVNDNTTKPLLGDDLKALNKWLDDNKADGLPSSDVASASVSGDVLTIVVKAGTIQTKDQIDSVTLKLDNDLQGTEEIVPGFAFSTIRVTSSAGK